MPQQLPAVSLVAVPGRRKATIEMAREIEKRGFAGIYAPSVFSNMSLCEALAHATDAHPFGTSIAPIYARTVGDFAQSAAFLHEVSGGRFRFGIGVSHAPMHVRMGVTPGKPLADIRSFVAKLRAHEDIGAHAARHPRHPAHEDDRARRRDRRRHGVRQRRPLAHGRVAGGAARGQARPIPPSSSAT